MLDLKRIRNNPEEIKKQLLNRGEDFELSIIDEVVSLDEKRRKILVEVEALKNKRNQDSGEIAKIKRIWWKCRYFSCRNETSFR